MAIDKRMHKIERKLEDRVFDVNTLAIIHKLIKQGHLDRMGGPISVGKEANVYSAWKKGEGENEGKETPVALKIYRIETSSFHNMLPYIQGDPRFQIKKDKFAIVQTWAKKEFQNLKRAYRAGVPCPRPIAVYKNVLVMSFIGDEHAAPELRNCIPEDILPVFSETVRALHLLYRSAGLVHGDMSEFNILIHNDKPVLIDFGQAVLSDHVRASELLERDCEVLAKFFSKHGAKTTGEDLRKAIVSEA